MSNNGAEELPPHPDVNPTTTIGWVHPTHEEHCSVGQLAILANQRVIARQIEHMMQSLEPIADILKRILESQADLASVASTSNDDEESLNYQADSCAENDNTADALKALKTKEDIEDDAEQAKKVDAEKKKVDRAADREERTRGQEIEKARQAQSQSASGVGNHTQQASAANDEMSPKAQQKRARIETLEPNELTERAKKWDTIEEFVHDS